MATPTKIYFHDKLDFEARNHFLTRSRSAQTVGHSRSRGVIFQPKYHQTSFARPNFVFHCKKARAGCKEVPRRRREINRPLLAHENIGVVDDLEHKKFCMYFPVLGTKDGLTEKARYHLSTSKTPYINPKPHDFRPLDNGPCTLRTLKTPDPTHLKLQIEGLSVIICDKGNRLPQSKPSWDSGPFCTRKTPEPHYVPSLFFPKGRYSPAFRAHDAYLDRVAWSISNKNQHNIGS